MVHRFIKLTKLWSLPFHRSREHLPFYRTRYRTIVFFRIPLSNPFFSLFF